jgi:alkanesulfonate monooxygenase SsuD/methylene tetrahydromethanopterin reductase-like flavin-dependent oxidoreductase (luciferase family)
MVEAQEDLTWDRWRLIVADVERLGFATLRISDHCHSLQGVEGRRTLAAWTALALAAEWTERIQIGPMVSPITFYVPAVLGRTAWAVDELSGGRLLLGVGAGWNEAEHERYGIPLPGWRERFDRLEEGIRRIRQALEGREVPFLIGGGGRRRTRTIAAREAAEWNTGAPDAEAFRAMSAGLDERCRELGRDPSGIRRSLLKGYLLGRDRDELRERAIRLAEVLPRYAHEDPDAILEAARGRFLLGTPDEVLAQMRPYADAGVDLFVFQHYLLDDRDGLELLAEVRAAAALQRFCR